MKKLIFIVVTLSLIIWYCGDWRPEPKTGEVVFDISSLLWKDIDEVATVFGDTSFKSNVLKQQSSKASPSNKGYFSQIKDGWEIMFTYELDSRKVYNVSLSTDNRTHSPRNYNHNQLQELMLIGNLSLTDSNKYVMWFDTGGSLGSMRYTYGSWYSKDETFTSIILMKPGESPGGR